MVLLLDRRNQRAAQLRAKVDMLKEKVQQISEDLKHDEKILELFERYNWDVGLQKVMEPRIRYLAAAAMTHGVPAIRPTPARSRSCTGG